MAVQHQPPSQVGGSLPAPSGVLTVVKHPIEPHIQRARDGLLIQGGESGHYARGREKALYRNRDWRPDRQPQQKLLRTVGKIWPDGPRTIKKVLLGHDMHMTLWGQLYVRQFHYFQRDPFVFSSQPTFNQQSYRHWEGVDRRFQGHLSRGIDKHDALARALGWPLESAEEHYGKIVSREGLVRAWELAHGWWEDYGLLSEGLVTTAFRDYLAGNFVTDLTSIGDFKFHRPGTNGAAESNAHTALQTDAGLEATGNQTNPTASTYQSVATVTADTTETWQEHSIRNATGAAGGTMLDRSQMTGSPASVSVVNLDTCEFTYVLTVNAET